MSKSAGDKEDEGEYFYESLDRIISSTSSSSSEDEDAKASNFNLPNPNSPMGVFNDYDVWISEPASVDERRMRLLHHMGLSRDPSLSRFKPPSSTDSGGGNSYRSIGGQIFSNIDNSISNPGMILPKPDNATDQCISSSSNNNNSNLNSSVFECNLPADVNETYVNNHNVVVKSRSSGDGSLCIVDGSSISSNKPPSGRSCRTDSKRFNLKGDCNALLARENGGVEEGESLDCDAIVRVGDDPACTIKNLDTGKKFVVNEVTGEGTWKKLKEVGTGRQLTMEEFEMCVGHSPIVQELMRRQNVEDSNNKHNVELNANGGGPKLKKKGNWLRSIKNVASSVRGHKDRRSSDERDTSSEKGGQRSSSATDDSQEISFLGPEKIRVRQYGKSSKELTGLYKSQEFQAHNGSIWTIKFSLDGKYLASAGEDCVIHVWQVAESERKGGLLLDKQEDGNLKHLFLPNGFPEPNSMSPNLNSHREKKRRGRSSISRKSVSFEHILVPETVFALSEKPLCSFQGHLHDVLDLSWSESQHLLSSSMDKTVRLWHLSSNSCLKTFSHSDYVTCIQFNPANDKYFISGSLDAKVRIWSIPDHQVVDWNDLHEMVTAACYTPDGQGALVGSYKGSCRLYNTSENKLLQQSQIKLHNKKPCHKKITGFQFAPGSTSEVLITSADSQIRVIDGVDLVHKFKGFRNTSSQISASITGNGKYVVCASEDSQVYIWKQEGDSRPSRTKGVTVTRSYEHFHCQDVSAAIPWPVMRDSCGLSRESNQLDEISTENHSPTPAEETNNVKKSAPLTNSYSVDRFSATWPEEKLLLASKNRSHHADADFSNGVNQRSSAWGMVIVTAGLRGEIRTFQNFGMPFRI